MSRVMSSNIVSWIMPKYQASTQDREGVPVKGFLHTRLLSTMGSLGTIGLLPVYELSDLYLLRPQLRERGTVCGLGYRIKRLVDTIPPTQYRYWRCLTRLRVGEWPVSVLEALLSQTQVSKWGQQVLWAIEHHHEIKAKCRHMRDQYRECVNNLVTEQQNSIQFEREWLDYERKQEFKHPNWERSEWIEPPRFLSTWTTGTATARAIIEPAPTRSGYAIDFDGFK